MRKRQLVTQEVGKTEWARGDRPALLPSAGASGEWHFFVFYFISFITIIIIWLHREAYRIVVPWPGIEPMSLAVEA